MGVLSIAEVLPQNKKEIVAAIGIEHGKNYTINCHSNMDKAEYYYEPITQINSEIRMGLSDTYQCSVRRPRVGQTTRVKGPQIDDEGRR